MASLKKLNTKDELYNFINNKGLNILKCSANWCGPCRVLTANIVSLDNNKVGTTNFSEIDVDENEFEDFISEKRIMGIPVLIFYKDGAEVDRHVGLMTKEQLYEKINELC